MLVFATLNSLAYGLLLFLLASGLTVVFGMLGVLNVAHASFYMAGAYLAYAVVKATGNFWLAMLLAPIAVAAIGVVSERFLLRKVHALGHGHQLLLTLGLGFIILETVKWVWGSESHPMPPPALLAGSVELMVGTYPVYRLFLCGMTLLVLASIAYVLFRTRLGMIVRAAVSDREMVNALGYNVGNVFTGVFGMGTFLAGFAGVIAAPMISVYPGMAADVMVDLFIVVVVGGLGSLKGALVASLLLGLFQSFGILLMPDFAMVFSFTLMAAVLVWRPLGLYGERAA